MRDGGFGSLFPHLLSTGSGGWRAVVVRLEVPPQIGLDSLWFGWSARLVFRFASSLIALVRFES
jgi:hypothetical protein